MRIFSAGLAAMVAAGVPSYARAAVPPASAATAKAYRHPDLQIGHRLIPAGAVGGEAAARVAEDVAALGLRPDLAFFDPRGGRLASLLLSEPTLPGAGNGLAWPAASGAPASEAALGDEAWRRVLLYLERHRDALRVDLRELDTPRIGVFEGGTLVQMRAGRVLDRIPVRESSVTAVIRHGNLVLLGLESWGDAAPARAALSPADARAVVAAHAHPHVLEGEARARLEYVPAVRGDGYGYRLAWAVPVTVRDDAGSWEGLVDAASGELLAFEDQNQYARYARGGVHPLSSDQRPPDGLEQPGWPLPLLRVTLAGGGTATANSSGSLGCAVGTLSTTLAGAAVSVIDGCGPIAESSAAGDLDLGFGPTAAATDCTVPTGHSAGDTKAARSTYFHATRANEQARGYLPGNAWLQTAVPAQTTLPNSCGASWSGGGITFNRDNGGPCRNAGEIAGVVAHEWGHGMDANGVQAGMSMPTEALADIHAYLRTARSCVGRGFFKAMVCAGYGDPCVGTPATGCTGVRDLDFTLRACGRPHTITSVTTGFPAGHCVDGVARPACPTGTGTPCGRLTHCESAVVAEAAFDLARRDLPAVGLDADTAHELATRLFILGSQAVTSWYTCSAGGGCSATGGYLQVLAADDDDGNLANGTPHMTAIRAAFQRHEIHCAAPAAVDSGCAGGPTLAPAVSVTPGPETLALSWTPVPNAARYFVYRTDSVSGCDSGKVKVADVTGTSFTDTGVPPGHPYSYVVVPVGANTSCWGRASSCASGVATADTCAPGGDFTFSCLPTTHSGMPGLMVTSACTVQSLGGFTGTVVFSCAGNPPEIQCGWNPTDVVVPPNGSADTTLTLSIFLATPGPHTLQARATDGALVRDVAITVNVIPYLLPEALAVDAAGNGVYQPNEAVVVAPAWRNVSGFALAVDGALANHAGPAGPAYAIPDAAASYGTIASTGTASCTAAGNCYTVANSATSRPATHWDTTAVETLAPSGTTKTWTLHVGESFTDVPPSNPFFRFIEILLHRGVTGGCTPATYCPASSTTREQMAVFVLIAKEGAAYVPAACTAGSEVFADVPASSAFCRWIEELADRGVVSGCGGGNYCPQSPVTREQMSVFVLRTLDPALSPPPCVPPNIYGDVPETSGFCRWIEELTNRGVVSGCGGGNYCPAAPVTREQMGVFLAVTFGLALYGV